jgi:hypothetical protein
MAATIADYAVLSDNTVTLQIGSDIDHTFPFTLPSNLNPGAKAVMTLRMEADDPSSLKWQMDVNGTVIMTFTHSIDRFCSIQEVFGSSILKTGSNNATVKVLSGSGDLKVSDIVLHFQANI